MKKILILCEGVTDQVFIADCLQLFYKIKFDDLKKYRINIEQNPQSLEDLPNPIIGKKDGYDIEINQVGGCKKLKLAINLDRLKDNIEMGGQNIVIFDADFEEKKNGNNGFKNATVSLNAIKTKVEAGFDNKVGFDYYLWHNNQDDGEVEDLIYQLIPENKKPLMQCIEQHQECLKTTDIEGLRYAELKQKIGFYLYTSSMDKTEGRYRDYTNTDFWDLNPKENQDLKTFKDFLDKYFI